jgi:hypothetical protein
LVINSSSLFLERFDAQGPDSHLASGFNAHNNLYGFMNAYSEPGALEKAIRANGWCNQWLNFRPGERNYEYYQSKRMVYNAVLDGLVGDQ